MGMKGMAGRGSRPETGARPVCLRTRRGPDQPRFKVILTSVIHGNVLSSMAQLERYNGKMYLPSILNTRNEEVNLKFL